MNSKDKTDKPKVNAINSRDDAKKFDDLLTEYSKKMVKMTHPDYLPLVKWWDKVQGNKNAARIFTAIYDLKLSVVLLNYDMIEIHAAQQTVKKSDEKTPIILQDKEIFFGRVDLHRNSNAYIIRYRALFDKVMGLLVLLHSPDDYMGFYKAKSRKKHFRKFAAKHPEIFPEESVDNFIKSLEIFDEGYRTSEVHGTGNLRRYAFSFETGKSAEYFGKLQLDSWNWYITVLKEIDRNGLKER